MYENEFIFRLIMIIGFACLFPIGLYHRLKSAESKEKLDRTQEGMFILATLRPVAFLRMFLIGTWLVNPAWLAWSSIGLPIWLRWVGVAIGIATALLLVWVFEALAKTLPIRSLLAGSTL